MQSFYKINKNENKQRNPFIFFCADTSFFWNEQVCDNKGPSVLDLRLSQWWYLAYSLTLKMETICFFGMLVVFH